MIHQLQFSVEDGMVFVHRASRGGEPVYVGPEALVHELRPLALYKRVAYRLWFDAQCCARVH